MPLLPDLNADNVASEVATVLRRHAGHALPGLLDAVDANVRADYNRMQREAMAAIQADLHMAVGATHVPPPSPYTPPPFLTGTTATGMSSVADCETYYHVDGNDHPTGCVIVWRDCLQSPAEYIEVRPRACGGAITDGGLLADKQALTVC